MAATSSIKIVKSIPFLGGTRHFSNRYHFNTGEPPDNAHWTTLANAVVNAEKLIYDSRIQITNAIAYTAGSDLPLFSYAYTTNGTFVPGTGARPSPGDSAMVGVYLTTARSTKNHPVYLFNYWHGTWFADGGDPDALLPAQRSLKHTYMQAWITGFSDGATTFHRAGPNGATAIDFKAPSPEYISHRDFPR